MLYARAPNFILLISCLHEHTIMEQSFDIVDVVNSCVGSFQLIYILTQNCKYVFLYFKVGIKRIIVIKKQLSK